MDLSHNNNYFFHLSDHKSSTHKGGLSLSPDGWPSTGVGKNKPKTKVHKYE